MIILRFNRVVFGVNSSPFLLNAVLRYHLSSFQGIDPAFVNTISQSLYVDDLFLSCDGTDSAYSLYCKARERILKGGFLLGSGKRMKMNSEALFRIVKSQDYHVMLIKMKYHLLWKH